MLSTAWTCPNKCNVFEVLGVPSFCPHCGTKEVYPSDEDLTVYVPYDEGYVNESTQRDH